MLGQPGEKLQQEQGTGGSGQELLPSKHHDGPLDTLSTFGCLGPDLYNTHAVPERHFWSLGLVPESQFGSLGLVPDSDFWLSGTRYI